MTTKDMLHILIKGQDALQQGQESLQQGQESLQQRQDVLQQGQDALKQELGILKEGQDGLKGELAILREEMRDGFKGVHERLDKQGKQLAYLEDDAPTREEYDGLTKRVEKLEKVVST